MIQKFDFEMLEKYLLAIRCKPGIKDGRFLDVWEVFGCFLAYRHGMDSTSLLEDVYCPDRYNTSGFSFSFAGYECLAKKSDEDLAAIVGCDAIEIAQDLEVFKKMYCESDA